MKQENYNNQLTEESLDMPLEERFSQWRKYLSSRKKKDSEYPEEQSSLMELSLIKKYWEKVIPSNDEVRSSFNLDLIGKIITAKNK